MMKIPRNPAASEGKYSREDSMEINNGNQLEMAIDKLDWSTKDSFCH